MTGASADCERRSILLPSCLRVPSRSRLRASPGETRDLPAGAAARTGSTAGAQPLVACREVIDHRPEARGLVVSRAARESTQGWCAQTTPEWRSEVCHWSRHCLLAQARPSCHQADSGCRGGQGVLEALCPSTHGSVSLSLTGRSCP